MNIRLQKYKKNRLAGMNQYNAAVSAGYSPAYANSHTKEIENKANIKDLLDQHGLTDSYLAKKHMQLLDAKKVIGYLHQYKKGGNGCLEKIAPDEVISNEFLDTDDCGIQIKALELAYKLKDHLKDKIEHSGKTTDTQIVIVRDSGNTAQTIPRSLPVQQ